MVSKRTLMSVQGAIISEGDGVSPGARPRVVSLVLVLHPLPTLVGRQVVPQGEIDRLGIVEKACWLQVLG